jgi:HSP20 family protein
VYSRDFLDAFWGGGAQGRVALAIDLSEDDTRYLLSAELPGVKREDVTVEVEAGVLAIRGEKKRAERDERRRVVERCYGAFARSFTLPSDADPERVEAAFKDGVLSITIAKREPRRPRAVAVRDA